MKDNHSYLNPDKIHFLETVDSTNTYCKQELVKNGEIVVANQQTAGRGRGNKSWISPGVGNIFFSGKVVVQSLMPTLSLFSLFVGGSVLKTLKYFYQAPDLLKIKWPNDIYLENKKISGVLIEGSTIGDSTTLIIGIGINLFWESVPTALPAAALFSDKNGIEYRDRILEKLIEEINLSLKKIYNGWIEDELSWLWRSSYLRNKIVRATIDTKLIEGTVSGLDSSGYLLVDCGDSIITLRDSGDNFQIIQSEPQIYER